jgi:hypothetical protein
MLRRMSIEREKMIEETKTKEEKLLRLMAGMTTGSRKQTHGFDDHAWDDEVLEQS